LLRTAGFIHVNRDIASALFDGKLPAHLWTRFLELPFVRRSDFGYQVHDLVFRHVYVMMARDAPAEMAQRHAVARSYWDSRGLPHLALYHCFMANPEVAVPVGSILVANLYHVADSTGFNDLVAVFESAAALVPEAGQFAEILRAVRAGLEGQWESARAVLSDAEQACGDTPVWHAALSLRIDALRYTGHLVEAAHLASEAIRTGVGGPRGVEVGDAARCHLLNLCAELEGLRGRHRQAQRAVGLLADAAASQGTRLQADILFQRDHLARWRGDWLTALECLIQVAELLGPRLEMDSYLAARVAYGAGRVLTYSGWFTAGQRALVSAKSRFEADKRRQNLGETLVGLSIVARETGDFSTSHGLLEEAGGLFTTGGTALYSAWVDANRFRTQAVDPDAVVDRDGALALLDTSRRMEYRLGEGHAALALEMADSFRRDDAADFFEQYGMRFEGLEARVLKRRHDGLPAGELAVRALGQGDFGTAALALDRLHAWLNYEAARGPQSSTFSPGEALAALGLPSGTPTDARFGQAASRLIMLMDEHA
jgi:hypothetical protein